MRFNKRRRSKFQRVFYFVAENEIKSMFLFSLMLLFVYMYVKIQNANEYKILDTKYLEINNDRRDKLAELKNLRSEYARSKKYEVLEEFGRKNGLTEYIEESNSFTINDDQNIFVGEK
ncbi:MAG: hypothetical protein CR982_09355 [Candidatus Cloacimonadota bacterium]|nr:MAG: hypothetical protein CR982_09355 [Candidatus Cloacimonadota bacterium]PIE77515.1 MAG: hypothetical protein CSA15_12645 [Candidatus Delongbacteria bacterium]